MFPGVNAAGFDGPGKLGDGATTPVLVSSANGFTNTGFTTAAGGG